jgi:4-hydroxy-3-methylbut-2-enyl diphosphate reductase
MLVVGGNNSCNTKNLAEIAEEFTKTYHIERADDLDLNWLNNINRIGITAGASTPDYLISEVIDKIELHSKTSEGVKC